jgi:dienelactone hydrolase
MSSGIVKSIASVLLLATAVLAKAEPAPGEIRLWEKEAPGNTSTLHRPVVEPRPGGVTAVAGTGIPSMIVHKPDGGGKNRPAVILCPGGGYRVLAATETGNGTLAPFLNDGFVVIVLKYRTVPNTKEAAEHALLDVKRAVRLTRHHSKEWGIDPSKIGVIGWSAGANLALNLSSHFDTGDSSAADPIETQSSRPDFVAMLCPWPAARTIADYPLPANPPPAFIASAKDDTTAPTRFAEEIGAAWTAGSAPSRLWIIEAGGHRAFSYDSKGEGSQWRKHFMEWFRALPAVSPGK